MGGKQQKQQKKKLQKFLVIGCTVASDSCNKAWRDPHVCAGFLHVAKLNSSSKVKKSPVANFVNAFTLLLRL